MLLLSALGRQRIADLYEFKSTLVHKVSSKPGNETVSQNKTTYKNLDNETLAQQLEWFLVKT